MMDRPRVIRVPHAHRTDGNRDPRREIIELTKQDSRRVIPTVIRIAPFK